MYKIQKPLTKFSAKLITFRFDCHF